MSGEKRGVIGAGVHLTLLALSAATMVGLAGYAWHRRTEPGARPFVALTASLSVWTSCYAVALTMDTAGARLFWERMQWLGIPFVSVSMLWFGLAYTGYDDVLTRRRLALLLVVPLVTAGLVWTNDAHHLIWTNTDLVRSGGLVLASQSFGPWYWLHLWYAYALIVVGSLALVRLVLVSDYLYLDQSALLLVGVIVPVASNAASVFGATPIDGIDLTPYALTVTGLTFGHALFRNSLFDLVAGTRHIGRNVAVSELEDGVVIVDDARRVVYCNAAAADVVGCDQEEALGDPFANHFDAVDLAASEDGLAEFERDGRTYEVRSSNVTDVHDRPIGQTLVLTDVTGRKRREEMLRNQRDELRTLDRINRVIREVNQALVGATTRAEVERAVPDRLVAADLYDAACIGTGVASVGDLTCSADGDSPVGDADGETALLSAIRRSDEITGPGVDPAPLDVTPGAATDGADAAPAATTGVPDAAADAGADGDGEMDDAADLPGSWTTVSLVYERTVYGLLVVYTTRPDAFGERELAVLDELGETIGHALDAIENRRLLLSDAVVELELSSTDDRSALVGTADALDCTVEMRGLVPLERGRVLAYLDVTGADPDAALADLLRREGVVEGRRLGDGETLELALEGGSLLVPLIEYGVNVQSLRVADGRCELVAETAPDTEVRNVVERVTAAYPDTSLTSKREREPVSVNESHPAAALADLTERQTEVLRAAYHAGYFDWPRESTAEDVADSLSITSPTLHNHLRKAQAKLLTELFDD